ncbi:phosphoglycerate mutase-like protein [Hypoxylon sp. NC0597]|nr:phosphoglycerate mutase-like protein [Hypoxylon sp. NC0597]
MAPTIDIIRHAESYHNLIGPDIPDPPITRRGEKQCEHLRQIYPYGDKVAYIVSSPLRRAIDTALIAIKPLVGDELELILRPELQEVNASPSSTGSTKEQLQASYNTLDMSALSDDWYIKGSDTPFAPNVEKVEARAKVARIWLRMLARKVVESGNEDAHIVVVTHGEFAHWLTDNFIGVDYGRNSGWSVCEFRSYQFTNLDAPETEDVPLVETQESLERRGVDPDKASVSPDGRDNAKLKRIASVTVRIHERALAERELLKQQELEVRGVVPDEESDEAWVDIDEDADKENQGPADRDVAVTSRVTR